MKAATVDKNSKAHLSPGQKPKPKEQVIASLPGVEEISVQTKSLRTRLIGLDQQTLKATGSVLIISWPLLIALKQFMGRARKSCMANFRRVCQQPEISTIRIPKKLKKLYDDPKPQSGTGLP